MIEITRAFLISALGDRQKFFFFTLVVRRVYQLGECRPEVVVVVGGGVEGGDGVEYIFVVESSEENRRNMFATHQNFITFNVYVSVYTAERGDKTIAFRLTRNRIRGRCCFAGFCSGFPTV